jgi:PAS domain S-box-containing protein
MTDKTIKVLLIEDNPGDARLIEEMLSGVGVSTFSIEHADRLSTGLERLAAGGIEVVLLDLGLPDSSGLDTFIRLHAQSPQVPIIVLSGLDDETLAVDAVGSGAQDYLIKGQVDSNLLTRAMQYAIKRKQAEKALREAEEQFRTIVETAPSILQIGDAEANNIYVSPNCEEISGYTQEELLDRPIWWVHEDDTPRAKELFERTFREGMGFKDFEYKAVKKNGDLWYASSSWKPLKDEEGKFKGICFQTIDITERKRAGDQLKVSLKEKEVLLREIHHRVKNNLQVVSSLLNMQARAAKDENTIAVLSESRDRINTMALIHTKLYESENLSQINMKGFVDGLLRQLVQGYPVPDTKITPVVHAVDRPLPISIAVPLGLVVNELLSNAFKHAFVNRKEGMIEVSLGASEEGGVSLTVSDDGVGLPEGFDIDTTKTLGLHLVKILVEDQLLGNLKVISDRGATFNIEFKIEKIEGS